jgi:hypothetical protein
MDLILTSSIYENYFDSITQFPKSEYQQDLISIINNAKNRFVVSKDLVRILEDKYANSPMSSFVLPFFANLINEQAMVLTAGRETIEINMALDIEKKYSNISSEEKKENYLVICPDLPGNLPYINATTVNDKGGSRLWFKIASIHPAPVTFTNVDFENDEEINQLIKAFFYEQRNDEVFTILDRQANFDHKIFDFFKDTYRTYYYTSYDNYNDNNTKIKKNFKNCQIFCSKKAEIHERKLVKKSAILHIDNDFWSVNSQDTTWTMSLIYCPKTALTIKEKVLKFKDPNKGKPFTRKFNRQF